MKGITTKSLHTLFRNTLAQHLLFWGVAGYVLLNIFSLSSSFQKIDFIYTAIFVLSLAVPVELNLLLFIPKFLNRKLYALYTFLFIGSLLFFSAFNQLLFGHLIDFFLPGYYFISYYNFGDILKFFIVFMGITTLLHLSKEWFGLNEARQRMILLEKEKTEAELKALSNQVNPHFLFNSLNVIYSLAMNRKNEAPEAILKLSDILRYVIYNSGTEEVTVASEIQLISAFIDLQKYRTSRDALITFSHETDNEQMKIAPMLCLPLVENSFKHGLKGAVKDTYVKIKMVAKNRSFEFEVENNKGKADPVGKKTQGGVGLENIRNRLELIYPGRHDFEVSDNTTSFRVTLQIDEL